MKLDFDPNESFKEVYGRYPKDENEIDMIRTQLLDYITQKKPTNESTNLTTSIESVLELEKIEDFSKENFKAFLKNNEKNITNYLSELEDLCDQYQISSSKGRFHYKFHYKLEETGFVRNNIANSSDYQDKFYFIKSKNGFCTYFFPNGINKLNASTGSYLIKIKNNEVKEMEKSIARANIWPNHAGLIICASLGIGSILIPYFIIKSKEEFAKLQKKYLSDDSKYFHKSSNKSYDFDVLKHALE